VKIGFGNSELVYSTPLELFQYSSAQYMLNNDSSNPVPIKNDPPSSTILNRGDADPIELPPYSLTVVRGRLEFRSPPTGVSNTHLVSGAIFIDH
jgi:hypothetical protein